MTLKEKFDNVQIMFENQIGSLKYDELSEASNHCENIADDFAIGFAEWIFENEFTYLKTEYIKPLFQFYKRKNKL